MTLFHDILTEARTNQKLEEADRERILQRDLSKLRNRIVNSLPAQVWRDLGVDPMTRTAKHRPGISGDLETSRPGEVAIGFAVNGQQCEIVAIYEEYSGFLCLSTLEYRISDRRVTLSEDETEDWLNAGLLARLIVEIEDASQQAKPEPEPENDMAVLQKMNWLLSAQACADSTPAKAQAYALIAIAQRLERLEATLQIDFRRQATIGAEDVQPPF